MYDLGREPISGVADFPHTLGYSAHVNPTSCRRRDKASCAARLTWRTKKLAPHDFRNFLGRRRVAAAAGADDAVDHRHADARQVAEATESRNVCRPECCARSMNTKSAARPTSIRPQSSARMRAVLPVAKQNAISGGDVAEARQHRDHAQDAERLHAGAGGAVGAENDAAQLVRVRVRCAACKARRVRCRCGRAPARACNPRRCSGFRDRAARCGRR